MTTLQSFLRSFVNHGNEIFAIIQEFDLEEDPHDLANMNLVEYIIPFQQVMLMWRQATEEDTRDHILPANWSVV